MVCEVLISVVCGRFELTKLGSSQSEFIRYDSEYAASMTRGLWKATKNKGLVRQCQETLKESEAAGVQVGWRHVKGHSGDRWNDRADRLADGGVTGPPGGEDVHRHEEGEGSEQGRRGPHGDTDESRTGQGTQEVSRPSFKAGGGKAGDIRKEPEASARRAVSSDGVNSKVTGNDDFRHF